MTSPQTTTSLAEHDERDRHTMTTTITTCRFNHSSGLRAIPALIAAMVTVSLSAFGLTASASAAPAFDVTLQGNYSESQIVDVRATGGQFRLRFGDGGPGVAETTDLPYNATHGQVQDALNALTNISAAGGSVRAFTSGAVGITRVTFEDGPFEGADVPQLVAVEGTVPLVSAFPDKVNVTTSVDGGMTRSDRMVRFDLGLRNALPVVAVPSTGDVLACNGVEPAKDWRPNGFEPTEYDFEWRRNGVPIAGESGASYTVAAADAGAAVQCLVKGTNASAASMYAALPAVQVAGASTPAPPVPSNPNPVAAKPSVVVAGDGTRTCNPPTNWTVDDDSDTSTPAVIFSGPWSYQWLRNGEPIDDATVNTYLPVAADDGKVLQCMITGTTGTGTAPGGGGLTSISPSNIVGTVTNPPTLAVTSALTNPGVIVNGLAGVMAEIELPNSSQVGVYNFYDPAAVGTSTSPSGWSCSVEPATALTGAKAVCTTPTPVAPQQALPSIGIGISLESGAPDPFAVSASVTAAGGSEPATATKAFEFGPAVPFGLDDGTLVTALLDDDYSLDHEYTQAGGHPTAAAAQVWAARHRVRNRAAGRAVGGVGGVAVTGLVKQLRADTPPGLVGSMLAVAEFCDDPIKLINSASGNCPAGSIVGEARYAGEPFGAEQVGHVWNRKPLYALKPERGELAQFAFADATSGGTYVLNARLRPEDGYAVSIDAAPIAQELPLFGFGASICSYGGTGSVPLGGSALPTGCKRPGDPGAFAKPFLTAPTACGGVLETRMSADSWDDPGVFSSLAVEEPAITGCGSVPFTPSVGMAPTSDTADSPSGLDASIDVPTDGFEDPEGISQSHLKKTVVRLPEGVAVNPSAAAGLGGCSDAQLGLKTDSEPTCPDGSKLGTVVVTTPALEETLTGVMVLRTPSSTDPMSGGMLRMALIVRNDERGVLVKLPGSATADPRTGRLVATFDDNPQLPIEHVEVRLRGGDRGVLAMPRDCGEIAVESALTPWSNPTSRLVTDHPSQVEERCNDGFSPRLAAGSSNNRARGQGGTYSFKFSREDGEQWLRGLTAKLPKGLLASVRDVPLCANGLANAGSCPASSKIGIVDAKAGSGDPFVLEQKGELFLTEGYKGGEYGLAVKIRPVAGPFRGQWELSPIVVRQAIHVDRTTAEVTAVSDPFPLIHHGIPLRAREVNVLVDRGGFMLNPSDCSEKQSSATLLSDEGTTAGFSDRFQVSGCPALPFKPKLALRLTGRRQVTTGRHPGVRAQVTQQGVSEAGIEKAVVRLPKSLALDVNNAQALCEFVDGTKPDLENHCPAGSIVGRARAKTPLLKDDLVGNVYFVKNVRRDPVTGNEIRTLPMIVVALRGEIAINLVGESDTTKAGKLVSTFASVPDAPVSQFNLNIKGGSNGILVVTRTRRALINLCAKPRGHVAESDMDGHNGRRHDSDIRMKTPCSKRQVKQAKRAAKRAERAAKAGRR